jgi:hypothetical protein
MIFPPTRSSRSTASVLLAVLTLLCGMAGFLAPRAAAVQFSDDEQKIANLLPAGFSPSFCKTATDPIPPMAALASLQCTADGAHGGPSTGRFTLWPDADTMNDQFQTQAVGSELWAPSPCAGAGSSPATWNYPGTPDQVSGQLLCGSFEGAPNIEWTRNAQLLTLDVTGGRDIDSLFQWWSVSGDPGGAPTTGLLA